MKICLVHGFADRLSGSGRYITDVGARLAEDGHEVTLVCHERDDAVKRIPGLEAVEVPRSSSNLWRFGHLPQLLTNKRFLRHRLAGQRFDVLLGSDLLFLKPIFELQPTRIRFIYTPMSMIAPIEIASYGLGGFRHTAGVWLYKNLQRWALTHCDRVVRYTDSAVRALERYYGLDLAQKAVVSVYVSREFESAATGADSDSNFFERPIPRELLWVGRLIESKNVAFLIRTAALIKATNWVLVICSTGPEQDALRRLTSDLGLADKVRFLGAVEDLPAVYRSAAIFLTGSLLEQYSLTLMEAYAFGVPCIGLRPDWTTVFNSNEDQIKDGATGYVINDEAQMAERIDALLRDEPQRLEMARNAFAMKQKGFSFESFYGDLLHAIVGD
jgi:glycosyltransferase involved in cell wall biosynthesis